jgi:hypothetical protein
VASASLNVNLAGSGAWTVSVIPANRSTAWLTANAVTAGSSQVMMSASSSGLTPGMYNATLLIQSTNAVPQVIEVTVIFLAGATTGIAINGLSNGTSFQARNWRRPRRWRTAFPCWHRWPGFRRP